MKRRDFIFGITSLAVISIPTLYYYSGNDFEYDSLLAEPQSVSQIWDNETILSIGNQYRSQVSEENNESALAKILTDETSGTGKELILELETKINNDFQDGHTIMIDGWILSITEARQCALFSTLP